MVASVLGGKASAYKVRGYSEYSGALRAAKSLEVLPILYPGLVSLHHWRIMSDRKPGSLAGVRALYCPDCRSVEAVVHCADELTHPLGYLSCGHSRTASLLPAKAGTVYMEPSGIAA